MTINIDFYGESTSCGYVLGQERDNPTPTSVLPTATALRAPPVNTTLRNNVTADPSTVYAATSTL